MTKFLSLPLFCCVCVCFQIIDSCQGWDALPPSLRHVKAKAWEMVMKSKADSTVRRYVGEITKFIQWCNCKGCRISLPIPAVLACGYLVNVYDQSKSYSSVVLVHAALKWFHSFAPTVIPNPLDTQLCHSIIEAAKRAKKPVCKKLPVTPEMIRKILDKYARDDNIKNLRLACICAIGFAGFFRFDELSRMAASHLEFKEDYLKIFVPKSKTDIYRDGMYVYVKRLESKYCPVALLERYLNVLDIDKDSDLPIFRAVTFNKRSKSYTLRGKSLSYTRCLELFKESIAAIGYDPKNYGLHSLRSGGATTVANNSKGGLTERLLKLHGRWKTDVAKDMYILDDVSEKLKLSASLGLS